MADTSRGFKKTSTTNNIADDINVNLPFNFDKLDEELNNIDKPQYSTVTKQEPVFSLGADAIKGQVPINANGLSAVNSVKNGNFNGTTNWLANYSTISANNGVLTNTGDGTNSSPFFRQSTAQLQKDSRKYYFQGKVRVTNANCTVITINDGFGSGAVQNSPESNKWYTVSGIKTITQGTIVYVSHVYADAATANGKVMEVKEVMAIDLTTIFGAGNEPTKEQCDLMFANYFDGIGSVNDVKIKSVGKNLFDVNDVINAVNDKTKAYLSVIDGKNVLVLNSPNSTFFTSLKPNTQYTFKASCRKALDNANISGGIYIAYTDDTVGYALIPITTTWETLTFTSSAVKSIKELRATYGTSGNQAYLDIDTIQIEEGTVATEYESYVESISPLPDLRSVPNGSKDEIIDGKLTKKTIEYIIQPSDITTLSTGSINNDIVGLMKKSDYKNYNVTGNTLALSQSVLMDNFNSGVYADTLDSVGKHYNLDGTRIGLIVAKGAYANLASAQTALAGTKIIYELAQPIVEDLVNPLTVFPKGTISIESDIETTIPELTLSYPINTAGVIDEVVDGVNQLAKIIYEDVHWDTATLQNGWTGTLQYRKNQIGQLEIKANITAGTVTNGTTISQLPTGYYPAENCAIPTFNAVPNSVSPTSLMLTSTGILSVRITNLVAGSILRFCTVIPMN